MIQEHFHFDTESTNSISSGAGTNSCSSLYSFIYQSFQLLPSIDVFFSRNHGLSYLSFMAPHHVTSVIYSYQISHAGSLHFYEMLQITHFIPFRYVAAVIQDNCEAIPYIFFPHSVHFKLAKRACSNSLRISIIAPCSEDILFCCKITCGENRRVYYVPPNLFL